MKALQILTMASALALWAAGVQANDTPVSDGPATPLAAMTAELAPSPGRRESDEPFTGFDTTTEADLLALGVTLGSPEVGPLSAEMAERAGPESIVGWDSRMLMKTSAYPNRAIGLITYRGNHHCTGWLINRNTIATAGHCVHEGGSGGNWYDRSQLRFFPGRDGSASPYGSCGVRALYSVNSWTIDGDMNYDYGAMKLDCAVGKQTGWFGMYVKQNPKNEPAIVTGYPGDKPQTQWSGFDKVRAYTTTMLSYRVDTMGGNSGSPVWSDRGNGLALKGAYAYAIHAYGVGRDQMNSGPRLTAARIANFKNWRAAN